jgi:hypothetical protein
MGGPELKVPGQGLLEVAVQLSVRMDKKQLRSWLTAGMVASQQGEQSGELLSQNEASNLEVLFGPRRISVLSL